MDRFSLNRMGVAGSPQYKYPVFNSPNDPTLNPGKNDSFCLQSFDDIPIAIIEFLSIFLIFISKYKNGAVFSISAVSLFIFTTISYLFHLAVFFLPPPPPPL